MAQGIPDEMLMNSALIKKLAEGAKDSAVTQGVLMRLQETPNSSEVRIIHTLSVYSTIAVDDFTARLFKIHQQILKEGRSQVCQHSRDDTGVRGELRRQRLPVGRLAD
uniref:Uncharacterized protein n=1 Tax=Neolamprologus brichardi TaxID=32507 RepID=A0A3Q4HJE6_NEOBR